MKTTLLYDSSESDEVIFSFLEPEDNQMYSVWDEIDVSHKIVYLIMILIYGKVIIF